MCLGRWPAEYHVAFEGFIDASFEPANFALLNENHFAVMYCNANTTINYTRLETEEIVNLAGDGEVTTNTETSAGDDVGATVEAEKDQQVVFSVFSHFSVSV